MLRFPQKPLGSLYYYFMDCVPPTPGPKAALAHLDEFIPSGKISDYEVLTIRPSGHGDAQPLRGQNMAVVRKVLLQFFLDVLNGSIGRMEDAQAQPLHVFHQTQESGAGKVCRAVGTKASVTWDHRGPPSPTNGPLLLGMPGSQFLTSLPSPGNQYS